MRDNAAKTLMLRKALDASGRRFIYDEETETSYEKDYTWVEEGRRLLSFANGYAGSISDCFIIYVIAVLGPCDRRTVQIALRMLKVKSAGLYIEDPENDKNIQSRIAALGKCGMLFAHTYTAVESIEGGVERKIPVRLYTADKDSINLMNNKLRKRVPVNHYIATKQLSELIEYASCAYITAAMSTNKNFQSYLDGVFRSKYLGSYYFPGEIKFSGNTGITYVAVVGGYLFFDPRIMTQDDFNDIRATKITAIKNYIMYRSKKGRCCVVIVVQDNDDLVDMAQVILRFDMIHEDLCNIYFTGEGCMRYAKEVNQAFLQMKICPGEEVPFDFEYTVPDFLD